MRTNWSAVAAAEMRIGYSIVEESNVRCSGSMAPERLSASDVNRTAT
nr:hypothetical protein [Ruania alba]